ncbi:hypothetical protein Patl1_06710 [Pistacia atlantica]|nr:hypothetical protein Patl1_06710 [Pistacia atlantica]
MIKGPAV